MFFLRQCWTCSTEFWLKSKALVRLQSIVVKISKSTGSDLLSWVCLKLLKILKGICYFPSNFPGKIAIWGCTRARWTCSQLPSAGGDARARCSGPCAQLPSGGETRGCHQTHQTMGKFSVFIGGFQGGTLGNSSNGWWGFFHGHRVAMGAIILESIFQLVSGAGFPPMVCRQHVWWVAKLVV